MRACSEALLQHLRGSSTTMCGLLKIGPLADGSYLCMTSLDRDLTYDATAWDPAVTGGEQTYHASTGFQDSAYSATHDLGVDNAEAETLQPVFPNTNGVTVEMIDRGDLDGIPYDILVVNYRDLSMGHIYWASGPLGEQIVTRDGIVRLELRSWSQLMKQRSVVQYTSVTCRADFGSMPIGTGGGMIDERFPCNYDTTDEWVQVVVTDVGTETVREFTVEADGGDTLNPAADYYAPGLMVWESGNNAGQRLEIEAYDDGAVSLMIAARNPVQVGDAGRLRRSCTKHWTGHNSCETYDNREWFRGEPNLMIGDALALNVPGVAGGGSIDGTGESA
ncbi:DUF2163 domain-containing protein [Luteimonas saliphila]|uniref:DUF2163 domain-containing protein n=1 Tax=Luteimonas saliphila TaxID=2804919 RepID=UPI00192D8B70|nr:DUF2163 domain-containing protein [Luteimonas saliphila]